MKSNENKFEINRIRYEKITGFFNERPVRIYILKFVYRFFPLITASAYIVLLGILTVTALTAPNNLYDLAKAILIPASAFASVTVFRRVINSPRPYETLGIKPLIPRNKAGHSFPSRHCASAFVISTVAMSFNISIGLILTAVSVCIAVSRVLSGVHFVRDVAAGALIGILFGLFAF